MSGRQIQATTQRDVKASHFTKRLQVTATNLLSFMETHNGSCVYLYTVLVRS